jgi:hypothetical protein
VETVETFDDLVALLDRPEPVYVRYSYGPDADEDEASEDGESGLELPGLSVNPLNPEDWWTRPVEDWLARQLAQYLHLAEQNPGRFAWVLSGTMVGRGPDCEPLLCDVKPIARLTEPLLRQAVDRYHERFDVGETPE